MRVLFKKFHARFMCQCWAPRHTFVRDSTFHMTVLTRRGILPYEVPGLSPLPSNPSRAENPAKKRNPSQTGQDFFLSWRVMFTYWLLARRSRSLCCASFRTAFTPFGRCLNRPADHALQGVAGPRRRIIILAWILEATSPEILR